MNEQLPPLTQTERQRLRLLQPQVQGLFLEFRSDAFRILKTQIYLVSTLRTFDEQNALYAQGRTRSGPIVTHARAGQSWHNFGLAFDIAIGGGPVLKWDVSTLLAQVGENCGLEWGGRWKQTDDDHFQRLDGLTLAAAAAKWPDGWRG